MPAVPVDAAGRDIAECARSTRSTRWNDKQIRSDVITETQHPSESYEIVSIKQAKAPPPAEGSQWHRYVIAQGDNTIRGYRQGTLATVTRDVEEIVTLLNERRLGKRGRVHIAPPPKKAQAPISSGGPKPKTGSR